MPDDHPDQYPPGEPSRPGEGGAWPGWQDDNGTNRPYPRQNLLPQEVKPGRSRAPLFIGIAVVLALVIAGGIAYLVLRDDGEDTRAAYCAALRDLTKNGDLVAAVEGANQSTVDDLKAVMDLAPNAVAGAWEKLQQGIESAQSGSPDMSQALSIFGALKSISQDAKNNCDLDLNIPML